MSLKLAAKFSRNDCYQIILFFYLFTFSLSASELENQLFSAINDISNNKLESGESKIKSILDQKPNFKLSITNIR